MSNSRCVLFFALLLTLTALSGCTPLSESRSRETRGGFTVRVDGPGLPTAQTVVADIGAYALQKGFARRPTRNAPQVDPTTHEALPPAPVIFSSGNIQLEVTRLPAEHRVSAFLHDTGASHNGRFIERFYLGFVQEFAKRYGGDDRISESAYADDTGGQSGSVGTLGLGARPDSDSPRESGIPPVSPGGLSGGGAPGGAGGPSDRP